MPVLCYKVILVQGKSIQPRNSGNVVMFEELSVYLLSISKQLRHILCCYIYSDIKSLIYLVFNLVNIISGSFNLHAIS
jgi:hypothetical protein